MAEDMAAWHAATVAASDTLQRATATHKAELARIRQGPLPAAQKPHEIAASFLAAAGKVAAAKRADTDAISQAKQNAEERAFKPPPAERGNIRHIMAARDAADRVRKITKPSAAHAVLDEAQADEDHSLARAVARHAHRNGWHEVTSRWADTQPPAVRGHLDDWAEATHLLGDAGKVARSIAYTVTQPPELSGMTQAQMRNLAAGATGRYGGP